MKRVLIFGPEAFRITESVSYAFKSLHWTPAVVSWKHRRIRPWNRMANRLNLQEDWGDVLRREFNELLEYKVLPVARDLKPDLILMIAPRMIEKSLLSELDRLNIPIIVWVIDSGTRYPGQMSLNEIAYRTYVMDGGDTNNENILWQPLGYDHRYFSPGEAPSQYDILFAGNIGRWFYDTRNQYLKLLRDSGLGSRFRVAFVGSSSHVWQNRFRWLPGDIKWIAPKLSLKDYASVIASSKITINIHQDDGFKPINPLFFAIPGCKTLEVAEEREYFSEWLEPGKEFIEVNRGNCIEVLEHLLNSGELYSDIVEAGVESAQRHTYSAIVQRMIESL